jgi:hypothetical protein
MGPGGVATPKRADTLRLSTRALVAPQLVLAPMFLFSVNNERAALLLLALSSASPLELPGSFSPALPVVPPGSLTPASPLVPPDSPAASLLVLPGSSFEQQLAYRTSNGIMFLDRLTAYTYQGGPLRGFDQQARSQVLAGVVRGCDEDGLLGEDPHGIVTSSSTELGFDWQRSGSGVRVACRGAQLVWNIGSDRWEAIFSGVRVPSEGASATFDELLLAICIYTCVSNQLYSSSAVACGSRASPPPLARLAAGRARLPA